MHERGKEPSPTSRPEDSDLATSEREFPLLNGTRGVSLNFVRLYHDQKFKLTHKAHTQTSVAPNRGW